MKIRSKLIAAVVDFLSADNTVPVPINPQVGAGDLVAPYAVVRISTAEPLSIGEPIWSLLLLVAVTNDADLVDADAAEESAEATFAPIDFTPREDETNAAAAARAAAFAVFMATKDIAVSAFEPEDSQLTVADGHWVHVMGFRVIAAEI